MMKHLQITCLLLVAFMATPCTAQKDPPAAADISSSQLSATSAKQNPSAASPVFQQRYPRYELRPDDVFDIVFEFTPDFNQTVTVQPDGYIALRGVSEIQVQGLTIPQLTNALQKAYCAILHEPKVEVVLKDFEKPYFIASGQVARPGKYDLRGEMTVTQAIAISGGLLDSAKHSQVVLFRRVSDGWVESNLLDVKKMLNHKNLAEDMRLRPGDMIFVPQNRISRIQRYLPIPHPGLTMNPTQF